VSRVFHHDVPGAPAAEDASIVRRMADGDASALGALYDRYARAVFSLGTRILSDRHEAEDVVQDVFAQAWTQARRYEARRATVLTWLLVMTRTRAIDRLRARRGRPQPSAADAPPIELRDPDPGQEAGVITAEQVGRLRTALAGLADAQRAAIELAYFEDLSQSEIAARLQEPLGTIKTRIRSGLQRLRAALESK
jgi:RNA polymerase sigma-70 factor (ECF subfamily)